MTPTPPPGAGPLDYLKALPQYLYPHHPLSRAMHRLTRWRHRGFVEGFGNWFVRRFGIDLGEAQGMWPADFDHFNALFTRALKPDARPLVEEPADLALPVDGTVSQLGTIRDGRIFQAKGRDYTLVELLGGDETRAAPFQGGSFATLYLSPRDYHRIHMPLEGRLTGMVHVPGRLFSVNAATARAVPRLFARNERVVALFDTAAGPMALVLVGAIFVASIETVWAGEVTPPRGRQVRSWDYRGGEAPRLARGAEMGRFNMGSTVIVLFGPGAVEWDAALAPGTPIRMGRRLGGIAPPA